MPVYEEGGDLNTRYEIEPMGRDRRMQISPITHASYLAIIIAVHARGCISYDAPRLADIRAAGKICCAGAGVLLSRPSRTAGSFFLRARGNKGNVSVGDGVRGDSGTHSADQERFS